MHENLQILLIAPQPFFTERGTPLNVKALAESLGEAGAEVDLLVYPLGDDIELAGVNIVRAAGRFLVELGLVKSVPPGPSIQKIALDIFLLFSALKLVFKNNYKIIHGIEEGAVLAGFFTPIKKSKLVYDMDSYMPEQLKEKGGAFWNFLSKIAYFFESRVIRRADAVLTVCASLTTKAQELVEEEKIFQIEDFPVDKICPSYTAQGLKVELGLENSTSIVYTGNFQPYQGVELLVEGFSKVPKEIRSANALKLLLVGGGGEHDALFMGISELVKSLGIEGEVILTGDRPLESMHAYMDLADILASPRAQGENTPLKVYSYMAANKPILATKIYSHTQVLDENNSFLAEPTADGMANAIEEILNSETDASKRAARAYELVNANYSKQAFKKKLVCMYKTLAPDFAFQESSDFSDPVKAKRLAAS